MKLLLDTHAFLWFVLDDPRLLESARDAVSDLHNEVLVSPATFWELAIKISIGKYRLHRDLADFLEHHLQANRFDVLPLGVQHAAEVARLPFHHRDPFDRMIVAQARVERATIVSRDSLLDQYSVARLW